MMGTLLGGIGLFLLGMILMTDGLKAAAGDALRRWLERLTGGAAKAMLTGVVITMLIQSSSATVLTTIGFVSAGLLTFTQAVGVIFGANLGTTSTGWIVSLLGFKVSLSAMALPLVGVGALSRFLLKGRAASLGLAVAGFGVIFVGIDLLQEGMGGLSHRLDPGRFPGATFFGKLALVAVGVAMTVVLQSSSAAVATTLTALHAGTIDLNQAVMLVIGQNLGTTVTAALASVGASVAAKRTALAHILFNVVAGGAAFLLAPAYLHVVGSGGLLLGSEDPSVAVAAFHTLFNLLGVVLLLPVAPQFASLVVRLVAAKGSPFARNLDASVSEIPAVAVEAARRAARAVAAAELRVAREILGRVEGPSGSPALDELEEGLREVRDFLRHIRTSPSMAQEHNRHLHVLHALDHLDRLRESLREAPDRRWFQRGTLEAWVGSLAETFARVQEELSGEGLLSVDRLRALSQGLAEHRRARRLEVLASAARGEASPDEALQRLEALRWLDRVAYHVWRAGHHLAAPAEPEENDGVAEVFPES